MAKQKERWGDPQITDETNEIDEYIESQIVIDGQLTAYGEMLYEQTKEQFYDEKTGEWITL